MHNVVVGSGSLGVLKGKCQGKSLSEAVDFFYTQYVGVKYSGEREMVLLGRTLELINVLRSGGDNGAGPSALLSLATFQPELEVIKTPSYLGDLVNAYFVADKETSKFAQQIQDKAESIIRLGEGRLSLLIPQDALDDARRYTKELERLVGIVNKLRSGEAVDLALKDQANVAELSKLLEEQERQANGLAELQQLSKLGLIDGDTFGREQRRLADQGAPRQTDTSVPRAIQAGSAEAFAVQANMQAQAIGEQIRLAADRAYLVQKATADATKKTSKILDDLKDNLGALPAP